MSVNVVDNAVTVTASQEVEVANEVVTNTVVNEYPNTISVKSNEFAVVGDGLFATTKEEVPGWMQKLVGDLVNTSVADTYNAMTGFNYNLYNAMLALQVAENTYQQVINSKITDQEAFVQAVETLNSTVQYSQAEIVGIKQTYATKDFAMATAATTLEASLNGGAIKSSLGQLASTMTNQYGTMAQRMDVLESTFDDLGLGVEGYASATSTLETYVGLAEGTPNGTGLLAKVEILEKQNDGIIETTTGTYDVVLRAAEPDFSELVTTAEPYASWLAAEVSGGIDVRLSHIGDVYIKYQDTASGTKEYVGSYKFIRTIVDTTTPHSTDSAGFTWAVIQDQAAEMAYTAALNAHDLADGKRRVFVGLGATTTPIPPYDVGDLWLIDAERVVNGTLRKVGDILRTIEGKGAGATYEQNDWVLASSYVDALNAEAAALENWKTDVYKAFVDDIQKQVDGKAETFYQATEPTGRIKSLNVDANTTLDKYVGDLWKNIAVGTVSGYLGNNTEYVYTKTAAGSKWNYDWVKSEVPDIVFDTIDTKKSIYSGNSLPVITAPDVLQINDMWITGTAPVSPYVAKSIYTWNGSAWVIPVRYTDDSAVNSILNGTTSIANAKIGTVRIGDYITDAVSVGTDNMVHVYSGNQNQKPTTAELGDLYVETNSVTAVVTTYRWNGASWAEIEGASNVKALADLSDGKRTIYTTANVPTDADAAGDLTVKVNDLWIPPVTVGSYRAKEIYICTSVNPITFALATDYYALINNVQAQVDGKVDTYYQATVPYSNKVNVGKDVRAGDYWYCTANTGSYIKGNIYKYLETANGSKYNYTWTLTADVTKSAFDAIDGKKAVYGGSAVPTAVNYPGLAVNDLWIPSADNGSYLKGEVYQYNGTAWVTATKYTEDLGKFVDNVYTPVVASLQSQVDSKIESWYTLSTADPKTAWTTTAERTKHNGDLWYQTDTKKSYYYRSSTHSWNVLEDSTAIAALTAASNAQATADGIVVSYYAIEQSTAPATSKLWLNGAKLLQEFTTAWQAVPVKDGDTLTTYVTSTKDTKVYVFNGTSWVTETGLGVVASSKAVTDLKLSLGDLNNSIYGTSGLEQTLRGEIIDGVATAESKFAYNSNLTLNGVTYSSGFGLATSLTPGSGIPVGSSEFWINADKFKLTTTGYNGVKYSPFSVNGTDGTITFNGKVSFNSVSNVPNFVLPTEVANAINNNTTTIDGAKITTGTIQAGAIAAGAITADKISAYALYGKHIYGATVEGATILGANIVGSVIKSSWLDFNDTGFLTVWQYFTSATVPPAYINNFAKDANGQIVVDSSGYVRLPTTGTIGDVKALRSTVYSRGHDEGPNGETVTIPAISTTAVAYDDYTTSSTFRFLKESSKISGGVLIDAYLKGGKDSSDYLTFDTYVKIGYDTYKIYVKIDDSDRWWITVGKSSSSNGVRNNNFGDVVNWAGQRNVAKVVYNDPTKPFTISAESYVTNISVLNPRMHTLHVQVYMSPDTYVSHSRVSGPLVSIDPIYIFRSDNDSSFSVTCQIPGIVYKSGLLILN